MANKAQSTSTFFMWLSPYIISVSLCLSALSGLSYAEERADPSSSRERLEVGEKCTEPNCAPGNNRPKPENSPKTDVRHRSMENHTPHDLVDIENLSFSPGEKDVDGREGAMKTRYNRSYTIYGSNISSRPGLLSPIPQRVEMYNSKNLATSFQTKPSSALSKYVGVSEEVTCSVCYANGISLNQMPGTYTTVMRNDVPLYSSVSAFYSLDLIPTQFIESIDIARGAGNAYDNPESLAGYVNIKTHSPVEEGGILNLRLGSFGQREFTSTISTINGKQSGLSISILAKESEAVDANNNGITERPKVSQRGLDLVYETFDALGFDVRTDVGLYTENRVGGAFGHSVSDILSSNEGNPFKWGNTLNGSSSYFPSVQNYDHGLMGISEMVSTYRFQTTTRLIRDMSKNVKVMWLAGRAFNNQDSYYSGDRYIANYKQIYLGNIWEYLNDKKTTKLRIRLDYTADSLDSKGYLFDYTVKKYGPEIKAPDAYQYSIPGIAVSLDHKLGYTAETSISLRVDGSDLGEIVSPRFSALLYHSDLISSRIFAGRGYRIPVSFFEFEHGILSVLRIERQITNPEISNNAGYTLSYESDRFALSASYNYNRVQNAAKISVDNLLNVGIFTNSDHDVVFHGVDVTGSYQFTPRSIVSFGLQASALDFQVGDLPVAKSPLGGYLSYEYDQGELWDIFARLNLYSSIDLQNFYGPIFNLDGTAKKSKSPAYLTLDLRATLNLSKKSTVSVGVENLFGIRQVDYDSYWFVDPSGGLGSTNIWGPGLGSSLYMSWQYKM